MRERTSALLWLHFHEGEKERFSENGRLTSRSSGRPFLATAQARLFAEVFADCRSVRALGTRGTRKPIPTV